MRFKFFQFSAVVSMFFMVGCSPNEEGVETNHHSDIPIPTQVYERMDDEEGYESKKDAWLELIHQSAPDVDWKEVNKNNFNKLMSERRIYKQSKVVEIFADGNLEGEWIERGSKNQAGNLRVVDFEKESELVYGISDNGSVWRSDLNGTSWTVLNDAEIFSKRVIKTIELSPGNRRIMAARGKGLWYSDDEGLNWFESTGFDAPTNSGSGIDLVQLNDVSNTILYLYNHDPFIGSSSNRIAYSIDNGETFTVLPSLSNASSSFASMSQSNNSSIAYVLDKTNNLFKFEGTGLTLVNSNLGISANTYVKLATSISSTDTVLYILKDKNLLYKSVDAGINFSLESTLPEPSWNVGIEVSEDDADAVYFGGMELFYSVDGGQNFAITSDWWAYYSDVANKIHADMMYIRSFVKNDGSEFCLIANHGGLSVSYDHLQTVTNIGMEGLNIGQFYDVITSPINSNYIFGGTQDQGYQRATNANTSSGLIDFEQVVSGDYGHMQFSNDGEAIWIQYPGADFSVYGDAINDGGATAWYNLDGNDMPAADWIVPTAAAPNAGDNYIYVAGGDINGGNGSYMVKLTFDGTDIVPDQFDFDFKDAGGGKIAALNASRVDDDKLYVGTENGKFYYSDNAGSTWTESDMSVGPQDHWLYGSSIVSSKYTSGLVFFGGSAYSNNGFFVSTDGGESMFPATDGLPGTAIHDLEMSIDDNWVFAATDAGPYAYLIAANTWYYLGGVSAPIVEYYSVEVVEDQSLVRFGTHGRGIWDFNITMDAASVDKTNLTINSTEGIYPNLVQSSILTVDIANSGQLMIYDLSGKLVYMTNLIEGANSLNHNLLNGVYVYAIVSENGNIVKDKIEVLR